MIRLGYLGGARETGRCVARRMFRRFSGYDLEGMRDRKLTILNGSFLGKRFEPGSVFNFLSLFKKEEGRS